MFFVPQYSSFIIDLEEWNVEYGISHDQLHHSSMLTS